jgi:hypothetical protein
VEAGIEGFDLFEQPIREFLSCANRNSRNVVNRFVRIELDALTAGRLQGINQVCFQSQQAQLKDLKQAARASTDDDDVGMDRWALELKR